MAQALTVMVKKSHASTQCYTISLQLNICMVKKQQIMVIMRMGMMISLLIHTIVDSGGTDAVDATGVTL